MFVIIKCLLMTASITSSTSQCSSLSNARKLSMQTARPITTVIKILKAPSEQAKFLKSAEVLHIPLSRYAPAPTARRLRIPHGQKTFTKDNPLVLIPISAAIPIAKEIPKAHPVQSMHNPSSTVSDPNETKPLKYWDLYAQIDEDNLKSAEVKFKLVMSIHSAETAGDISINQKMELLSIIDKVSTNHR